MINLILIRYNHCFSHLSNLTKEQSKTIDQALAVKSENAWRSPVFQSGRWDGKKHFYLKKSGNFPTGLLRIVVNLIKKNNWEYKIENYPGRSVIKPNFNVGLELRDYQKEAVITSLKARRGILYCAVNAGKTVIGTSIIKSINKPTLWITHLKILQDQTIKELKKAFPEEEIGIIGQGKFKPEKITVAIIKSLCSKDPLKRVKINQYLKTIDVLINDEFHRSCALNWYSVIMKTSAKYKYGLSGTPIKENDIEDTKLVACTGNIIYHISQEELIKRGISAKPTIYMIKCNQGADPVFLDAQSFYQECIVENKYRNSKVLETIIKKCKNKPTIIYVERIEHGKWFEENIENSKFIYGETKKKDRDKAIKELVNKKIDVLITSVILKEGINIYGIEVLIIASAGKKHIQTIGRALRGGNRTIEIYDFQDSFNKSFNKQTKERIKKYEKEGFEIKYK